MMAKTEPQYAIGVDLGTTNCVLAYRRLDEDAETTVLPLPQWVDAGRVAALATLPSFLYLPHEDEREAYREGPGSQESAWVVGRAAREQAGRTPGRVVHSAKSWLAHHGAGRGTALLPWQSPVLETAERLSPTAATAQLLRHLRSAWEAAFPAAPFGEQVVTVTVPASFDAGALEATREAAVTAGYPATLRLLEEPQAAFYRWLEATDGGAGRLADGTQIVVVDVGGGTSDFSLFRVTGSGEASAPQLERVAVSEHLLLGGDNIDLALAHCLEAQLVPEGQTMEGEAWNYLVARARELKERVLSSEREETLRVAAPGRGSGLLAQTISAELTSGEVREIVLEGFFPPCDRHARPEEGRSALQEWGLPYAADFAVTRYLAAFVRGHPSVGAVLFNGGSLAAPLVRERLREQLADWQDGVAPEVLANAELDLAVARGAAFFGAQLAGGGRRIAAGAARGIFLEVGGGDGERRLVCVLPRGAEAERRFLVQLEGLRARVNQAAHFQAFQGAHGRDEKAGAVVRWNAAEFSALPSLEATLTVAENAAATVPVVIEARLSELGWLELELVAAELGAEGRWPLAFRVREAEEGAGAGAAPERARVAQVAVKSASSAMIEPDRLAKAEAALRKVFSERTGRNERLTPGRVFTRLERTLGLPRFEWPLPTVRALADVLLTGAAERERSPEHLETWLYLVGWLGRPGFGDGADPRRLNCLWELMAPERFVVGKRTEGPYSLLWRRLAGGLTAERQRVLWEARGEDWLNRERATVEGIRLAGALERLEVPVKTRLAEHFLREAERLARSEGHPAPYLAALTGLLARSPQLGGVGVVPPAMVELAWKRLSPFDWSQPRLAGMAPLFLRAARRVEAEDLNCARGIGRKIADRLSKIGVSAQRVEGLRVVIPMAAEERLAGYDEALPPGLVWGEG